LASVCVDGVVYLQFIFIPTLFLAHCRYKTQQFNSVASQTSGSLLLLAAISILIPTAAQQLGTGGGPAEKALDALIGDPMPLDKV
jgi:Ca2+/H+ antiporter